MDNIRLMMNLIRQEVCGYNFDASDFSLFSEEDSNNLYLLSKAHDLAHVVGSALDKNGLLKPEYPVTAKYKKQMMLAVFRVERLNFDLGQISSLLEGVGIAFIPLKGSVLRGLYPNAYQRTSCDIDVLVKEKDLKKSVKVLEENGYRKEDFGSHDVSMFSPSGNHVELHYDLVEDGRAKNAKRLLKDVWEFAKVKDGYAYQHELNDEMFYFYHVAHMAKHFENGGCGVRSLIDLWILNHKIQFSKNQREETLKTGGLIEYEQSVNKLSEVWFSGKEQTEITEKLQNYIISGGIYGTTENKVVANRTVKGGKAKYILGRIFLKHDVLKYQYPILKKHKWLTPFMQIRRWFRLVFRGGIKRSVNEIKVNARVSEQEVMKVAEFFSEIGLR